jgi:hypothetical protein
MKSIDQQILEQKYKLVCESDGNPPRGASTRKHKRIAIKLVSIKKNEGDGGEEYEDFENQGGSVLLSVNGKPIEVIVNPSGEYDFEGDITDDREMNAILNFVDSDPQVAEAFPVDEFE